jgi:putative DNA primase/helicase
MDAGEFLSTLWGDPPPGQVLVWTLPQKRSVWYNRLDNVRVGDLARSDVYTGVGIAPAGVILKSGQRATTDAVAGIAGLWADVDYAGENHKKPNLPETEADALWLIDSMPAPASIVLNSGHGLQAWWLFDRPWMFEDDLEREEAQAMARGWHGYMAGLAAERDWVVDATHDLARVMRLPGTFNNKSSPVPVRVIYSDGPRIGRDIVWDEIGGKRPREIVEVKKLAAPVDDITLDPAAEPPLTKYTALRDTDRKFKRSTDRDRQDLPDQSASSYDMSLASIAATAGWSDQEIVDTLIYQRRKNGDDLKLREDYYARTIAKARGPGEQAEAQERLEEGGSLADLSILLGVEIIDLVKHMGDPPEYWMETTRGSITLGPVHNISNQTKFIDAVATVTSIMFVRVPAAAWARRAASILTCCREVELGEASHPGSEMGHWVTTYLDSQTILNDQGIAAEQGLPFHKDGAVMFALSGLRQYLRFSVGEQLSSHKLGQRLRLCGIEPLVIKITIKGTPTSRNYWRVDNQFNI